MAFRIKIDTFAFRNKGKVLEWLKRHAWKACIPLKGIGGSNPPLSAYNQFISPYIYCVLGLPALLRLSPFCFSLLQNACKMRAVKSRKND